MLRTLYAKLSVALVAIVLAIGVLYAVFALVSTRHYLEAAEQRLNRDLARDLVADRNLVEEGRINEPALKDLFHDYMVVNPSIEIYLLDLEGRILSFSADPGAVKRKYVSLGPVRAFLAGEDDYPPARGRPAQPRRAEGVLGHRGAERAEPGRLPLRGAPRGTRRFDRRAAGHQPHRALQRVRPPREPRGGGAGRAGGAARDDPPAAPLHRPHRPVPGGGLPGLRAVRDLRPGRRRRDRPARARVRRDGGPDPRADRGPGEDGRAAPGDGGARLARSPYPARDPCTATSRR